jgi:hypothetical protein
VNIALMLIVPAIAVIALMVDVAALAAWLRRRM